jgi:glucokinase
VTESGLIVALDFGGTKMAAAVAGSDGQILDTATIPTKPADGADPAMQRILDAAAGLARRAQGADRVTAVGVATMGITLADRVLFAPNVPGWERLAIPSMVRGRFPGAEVQVDNDVKAAAWAELTWGALQGAQTAIYLNLGTGIAAALITGGRVHGGAHGAAGEIGYAMRSPAEKKGARSGHAPFEEFASGAGFRTQAPTTLGETLEAAEIFSRADSGDEQASAFVAERIDEIAFHLVNLAIAIDPERIAVGGGFAASAHRILPRLKDRLEQFVPFPPDLQVARFLRTPLRGAVALGLQAAKAQ